MSKRFILVCPASRPPPHPSSKHLSQLQPFLKALPDSFTEIVPSRCLITRFYLFIALIWNSCVSTLTPVPVRYVLSVTPKLESHLHEGRDFICWAGHSAAGARDTAAFRVSLSQSERTVWPYRDIDYIYLGLGAANASHGSWKGLGKMLMDRCMSWGGKCTLTTWKHTLGDAQYAQTSMDFIGWWHLPSSVFKRWTDYLLVVPYTVH